MVIAGVTVLLTTLAACVLCAYQYQTTPETEQPREKRVLTRLCLVNICVVWVFVASLLCRDNTSAKAFLVCIGWMSPLFYLIGIYFTHKLPVFISFSTVSPPHPSPSPASLTLLKSMKRNSFWLIFFTTAVIYGSGSTLRNNLFDIIAHIKVAIDWSPESYYLLMTTVEAAAGLGAGLLAAKIKPRLVLCGLCFAASVSMFVLYMGLRFSFICGVVITGMSLGALKTLMPVMVFQEFGAVQFSRKYGFMLLAYSTGAVILSTAISSHAYFIHIGTDRAKSCEGDACFSMTFAINCAATCLAALAMLALTQAKPVIIQQEESNRKDEVTE